MAPGLPRRLRSTTLQFIGLVFLAQFIAVLVVVFFMRIASERILLEEQQELVAELRNDLVAAYEAGGDGALLRAIDDRLQFRHGQIAVILLTTPDGRVVAGNLDAWPPTITWNEDWVELSLFRKGGLDAEDIGFTTTELADGSHLLTGHVIDGGLQLRAAIGAAVMLALLAAVPLSLGAALIVGRTIERRVAGVARTAADVSRGNLTRRVETRQTGDAFDHLGEAINDMLGRIEQLVTELRVVTDGLAHDLRSPVTRLTSTIERSIVETSDPDARATLEKVSEEARQLLAMLTTALQISRAEAGIGRENFVPVGLSEVLADIVEIYGPVAEDAGFDLSSDAPAGLTLSTHRELLSQALGNLVENAVNYATGGDTIRLSATSTNGAVVIEVADNGPGIPAESREQALKRFGRLDPSRHRAGSGLGLTLVEAVTRLSGGSVELADNGPGLIVRMIFPA